MTAFLGPKPAIDIAKRIWELMLDGQAQPDGIPTVLAQAEREAAVGPVTEEDLMARIKAFSGEMKERVGEEMLNQSDSEGERRGRKKKKKKHKDRDRRRRRDRSGS